MDMGLCLVTSYYLGGKIPPPESVLFMLVQLYSTWD